MFSFKWQFMLCKEMDICITMNPMRIITQKGMVNIDGHEITYGNIKNMYTTDNGNGLQLSERLEHKRGEIIDICAEIADKIYELQDIMGEEK